MSCLQALVRARSAIASERAVRAWRFTEGRLVKIADGADFDGDGRSDYRKVVSDEAIEVYYDVRFDFAIVEGEGQVTRGQSTP